MTRASATSSNYTSDRRLVRQYLDQVHLPETISEDEKSATLMKLRHYFSKNCYCIHYYTDASLQDLAETTGGYVGDSLEMAFVLGEIMMLISS